MIGEGTMPLGWVGGRPSGGVLNVRGPVPPLCPPPGGGSRTDDGAGGGRDSLTPVTLPSVPSLHHVDRTQPLVGSPLRCGRALERKGPSQRPVPRGGALRSRQTEQAAVRSRRDRASFRRGPGPTRGLTSVRSPRRACRWRSCRALRCAAPPWASTAWPAWRRARPRPSSALARCASSRPAR